jgi:ATP-dependent Zn protease
MNIFNKIEDTILSLIPYWGSHILNLIGVGNEYNVLINLFLNVMVKNLLAKINESNLIIIIIFLVIIIILYKTFNINDLKNCFGFIKFKKTNTLNELIYTGTINNVYEYILPEIVSQINNELFNKYKDKFKSYKQFGEKFIINSENNIELEKNIFVSIITDENDTVIFKFTSTTNNLFEFINNLLKKENNPIIEYKTLYHFLYTGFTDKNNSKFKTKILSSHNNQLYETFDNLITEHSEIFVKDIDKLNDLNYYKKRGLRRKLSYLLYGIPGSGKTASVISMALYDKRHIIEIPFELIVTKYDLDYIFDITSIGGIEINKNEVIFLFDEIEKNFDIINKLNNDENQTIEELKQNLNIGYILSKFDGICNYEGLILIATANNIDNLDPALHRDMRLTKKFFTYLRREDVIKILNKYYEIEINDQSIIDKIPDRQINGSKLISLLISNENLSITDFIKLI